MCLRSLLRTLVVVAAGGLATAAVAGVDAGERCRMLKLSATSTHARELVRCHVRAIGFAMTVVPSCLATADAKLARTFARAEKRAGCPPTIAEAQDESARFVAALLARAAPTPVPTPSPTPSPSPQFTGCGNAVVEAGEQCDGQSFCTSSCGFRLPTVCCGPAGFCIEGEFPTLADQCFLQGAPYTLGAVCAPSTPGCSPSGGCEGSCLPEATFAATGVCCELSAGCAADTITSTVELWQFVFQGCIQAGGTARLGTCGDAGNCVPGG
jgi:hypothetical protein